MTLADRQNELFFIDVMFLSRRIHVSVTTTKQHGQPETHTHRPNQTDRHTHIHTQALLDRYSTHTQDIHTQLLQDKIQHSV